jgi:hypothetical protein
MVQNDVVKMRPCLANQEKRLLMRLSDETGCEYKWNGNRNLFPLKWVRHGTQSCG